MDNRLEKIKKFAEKRDTEIERKKTQYAEEVDNYVKRIMEKIDRVIYFCDLASECRKNNITLGEKQDSLHSEGLKSNCFISNGWSHYFGFNRELTALGFYNGGACGETNMFLFKDGNLLRPINNEHEIRCLKLWNDRFEEFEKAFLDYIDNL